MQLALVPDVQCATNSQPRNVVCVIQFVHKPPSLLDPLVITFHKAWFNLHFWGKKRSIKIKIKVSPGVYTYPSLPMLPCLPACLMARLTFLTPHHIASHHIHHHITTLRFLFLELFARSVRKIYLGALPPWKRAP